MLTPESLKKIDREVAKYPGLTIGIEKLMGL